MSSRKDVLAALQLHHAVSRSRYSLLPLTPVPCSERVAALAVFTHPLNSKAFLSKEEPGFNWDGEEGQISRDLHAC
jgi:hypothetical protein